MTANAASINELVTATHVTDGYGNVTGLLAQDQITFANANGICSMLMLGNNFDGNVARTLLQSAVNRTNLINNLVTILGQWGYKGVNIDLEGIFASERTQYTQFLRELNLKLKPLGYRISVSVPAKTVDLAQYSWTWAYDYASLSPLVDQMLIMAYDEHYSGGTPGPIASISWVESVLKYTTSVVEKNKVYLGVAAYGYDWSTLGTKGYSISGCLNLAGKYNATVNWDEGSKTSYFKYWDANSVEHTVWFENATSLSYKLALADKYGVSGVGIWRLGLENTEYWNVINEWKF